MQLGEALGLSEVTAPVLLLAVKDHARALEKARAKGRQEGIRAAMEVCREEGATDIGACVGDLLEQEEAI